MKSKGFIFVAVGVLAIAIIAGVAVMASSKNNTSTSTNNVSETTTKSKDTQISQNEYKSIEIVKSGFTQDGENVFVGMVVKNPNSVVAKESTYNISVYDSSNQLIGSVNGQLMGMVPSQVDYYVADAVSLSNKSKVASSLKITIDTSEWSDMTDNVLYSIGNANYSMDDYGQGKVLGEIENTSNKRIDSAKLSLVMFDANGNVIAGGVTTIDMPSKANVSFDVHTAPNLNVSSVKGNVELKGYEY